MNRLHSLIHKLRIISNEHDLNTLKQEIAASSVPVIISFINAHAVTLAYKDDAFFKSLIDSDILLRDGIGMSVAIKVLGCNPGINMNGTDFIPDLIESIPCKNIAMYGTCSPWLELAALKLPPSAKVQSMLAGFEADYVYVENAKAIQASIILLGMGMPKQERVAAAIKSAQPQHQCIIINGGAILDFMAERVKRAPPWMRSCRLEWLFRLIQEPRRLAGRYSMGALKFLYYVLAARISKYQHD